MFHNEAHRQSFLAKQFKPKQENQAMATQPPLGTGQRFAALKAKLAQKPGITNPAALAASIGRKKFGASKFNMLAKKGKAKKRHAPAAMYR